MAVGVKAKKDWGLFAWGVLLVLAGFVLMIWPGLSLVSIAITAGALLIVGAVFDAVSYVRLRGTGLTSGWAIVNAICSLILGIMFVANPIVGAEVIPMVCGVFVIVYAIVAIIAAISLRKIMGWGLMLANGLVSLLCGIMFIVWPATFAIFLAVFVMMRGVTMAYYGIVGPQDIPLI